MLRDRPPAWEAGDPGEIADADGHRHVNVQSGTPGHVEMDAERRSPDEDQLRLWEDPRELPEHPHLGHRQASPAHFTPPRRNRSAKTSAASRALWSPWVINSV